MCRRDILNYCAIVGRVRSRAGRIGRCWVGGTASSTCNNGSCSTCARARWQGTSSCPRKMNLQHCRQKWHSKLFISSSITGAPTHASENDMVVNQCTDSVFCDNGHLSELGFPNLILLCILCCLSRNSFYRRHNLCAYDCILLRKWSPSQLFACVINIINKGLV